MSAENYIEALRASLVHSKKSDELIDACVAYANILVENKLPVIFDLDHLCLLLGIEKRYFTGLMFCQHLHYKECYIPKRSGGARRLLIPSLTLKYVQRWILDNILSRMHQSEFAVGFKKKNSIVDNAKRHINQKCVVNIDIADFFPSIKFDTIFKIFYYYGYTKEISFILAQLCTYENELPQGSPASPCISNITCLRLDKRLLGLARSYNANYSRYADDITFSGNPGIENSLRIVEQILDDEGFTLNHKKTRLAYTHQRQEVTGLIVNDGKVRVSKRYKRSLMQEIYYCRKFGVDSHLSHIESIKKFYKEHLYGKAYFVYMVEPNTGKEVIKQLNEINWDY